MADFTWIPDRNISNSHKFNTKVIKFGDGYSQRVPAFVNNLQNEWSLNFANRTDTEIDNIYAFLISKEGATAFTWQPPGDATEYKVVCMDFSRTYVNEGISSLNAKFMRVYE